MRRKKRALHHRVDIASKNSGFPHNAGDAARRPPSNYRELRLNIFSVFRALELLNSKHYSSDVPAHRPLKTGG